MTETATLCITVNRGSPTLAPSETFLRAHMERLPFRTVTLIGHPGDRKRIGSGGTYLQSRATPSRGARWALDRLGIRTRQAQDTRALTALLRRERVAVMLAEYGPTALTVMDACEAAGVPLLTHFHGWDAYVLAPQKQTREAYRALFAKSEAIIAVSRHMRDHLIALGAPADRTVWNPCGAELAEVSAKPAASPPSFLSVGRSAPKKATVVTLLAFAQVLRALPEARLSLVGAQGEAAVFDQLMQALHIAHAVTFHGPLPHDDVLALMQSSRCYVHPSVTAPNGDMEGTPVSVLEAMACGLPVVSTRHGGIIDVLAGTDAGRLVDEYDVDATADAMLEFGRSPEHAAECGAEGRRLLAAKWSMRHSLDRLADVLQAASRRDRERLRALATSAELSPAELT